MKHLAFWNKRSHPSVDSERLWPRWPPTEPSNSSRTRKIYLYMSTLAAPPVTRVPNYINGGWHDSSSSEWQDVMNPATGEVLASVPLSSNNEVAAAVEAAAAAFPAWRRTPPEDRIQPLFKLKQLLEEHLAELARIITLENGKTLAESKAELRRAIENVEVACGIPTMMQGYNLEDVARGIA